MDVRCERCKAQYQFEDAEVGPAGLAVQCTQCGHVFVVKKKEMVVTVPVKSGTLVSAPVQAGAARRTAQVAAAQVAAAQDAASEYRVRLASGQVFACRDLTTLQKWVVERRIGRDDEVAPPGENYRKLSELAELDTFFDVVAAADRAPAQPAAPPPASPPRRTTAGQLPAAPAYAPSAQMDVDLDLDAGERAAVQGGHGVRNTFVAIVALAVIAGGAWVLAGEQIRALLVKPPPPAPVAAPAPPPPEPKPEPKPVVVAPAPEPEPPPPAPVAEPEPAKPAPAPEGMPKGKTLLARAERLRQQGATEKALKLYDYAVDLYPDNADALAGRGLCYLDLERNEEAVTSFRAALREDPEHEDALLGAAEAYRSMGRTQDAIQHYEKYLASHPAGEEAQVARNALEELRR